MKYLYILVCLCVLSSCTKDDIVLPSNPTSFFKEGVLDSLHRRGLNDSNKHQVSNLSFTRLNLTSKDSIRVNFLYSKFSYDYTMSVSITTDEPGTTFNISSIPRDTNFISGSIDTTFIIPESLRKDNIFSFGTMTMSFLANAPDTNTRYFVVRDFRITAH